MTLNLYASPKATLSSQSVENLQKVGIVNIIPNNNGYLITFSKPYILIYLLLTIVFLPTILTILTILANPRTAIPCITILLIPSAILLRSCYKLYSYNKQIELKDNKIIFFESCRDSKSMIGEVDISQIHSISSEEIEALVPNLIVIMLARYLPKHPEILIVADPKNLTIKGPRKFTSAEMKLLLKTLNSYRHKIALPSFAQ